MSSANRSLGAAPRLSGSSLLRFPLALLGVLWVLGMPDPAQAIPAFARAYEVPCSTCHITITRRGEFGDAFRRGGFHWPGELDVDAKVRKEPPVEMRGVSAMDSLLPARLPLSLAARVSASSTNEESATSAVTLGSPSFNLLFGGALAEHVSFFGTWAGTGAPNELYLHFARLFNRPELNLRFGKFEQWTTLFKNNEALINSFQLTSGALSGHSVGQGRVGAEANGTVLGRGFWAAGIVQNEGPGSNFDGYYHLGAKIGGMDFLGEEPDIDLDSESPLDEMSLTLGTWGYSGAVSDVSGTKTADIRRLGAEMKFYAYNVSLWAGLMLGFDEDALVQASNSSTTWFAELSYPVTSWLLPMYMYQYQDAASFEVEAQRHDLGVMLLPLENLRTRVKFSFIDDDVANESAELQFLFAL